MRNFLFKLSIFWLILGMAFSPTMSYAQALPLTRVGLAVGKTLVTKMKNLGFAANDPRYIATVTATELTLSQAAGAAASAGGGALIGAIGAPVWLTIAAGLALGYAIPLALDAFTAYLPSPSVTGTNNPRMQVASSAAAVPLVSYPQIQQVPNPNPNSNIVWTGSVYGGGTNVLYAAPDGLIQILNDGDCKTGSSPCTAVKIGIKEYQQPYSWSDQQLSEVAYSFVLLYTMNRCGVFPEGTFVYPNCVGSPLVNYLEERISRTGGHCPAGNDLDTVKGLCIGPATISQNTTFSGTSQEVANGKLTLSPALQNSPVNPEWLARIADSAWRNASMQPGYKGVPYTSPVTAQDVATAYAPQNNPGADTYPTVADLIRPATSTGSTNVAINPSASTNTGSTPSVDLGPDPAVPQPALETIPTARQILDPILNLMPDLRNFQVPQHASECPKAQFSMFGKSVVVDAHCSLLESVKPTLTVLMGFIWAALALFIILSA